MYGGTDVEAVDEVKALDVASCWSMRKCALHERSYMVYIESADGECTVLDEYW